MEHVGPFFFNGVRFALGCLPLLPFVLRTTATPLSSRLRHTLPGGLLAGLFLFIAASLQQVGIVYTTAGKAGFITGLYVILVPISVSCYGIAVAAALGPALWWRPAACTC